MALGVLGVLAATPQVRALVLKPANGTHHASAAAYQDQLTTTRNGTAELYKARIYTHRHVPPDSHPSHAATRSQAASSGTAAAHTLSCTGTSGMLPENYPTIVSYLTAHGYTAIAAAGIAGNIYQESKGNPESEGSGGGGLIGWTPLPAGFVTGNMAADLQTQLAAILRYNQQWAQYIPALNAAPNAADAAAIYMDDFERPGIPAASSREGAATAVAAACGI